MAILIGVIALAVIPNIQRSRESKDLTTLDNVLSSVNIAIANNKVTGTGDFELEATGLTGDEKTINDAVVAELGSGIAGKLGSTNASGKKICVKWTAATASAAAKITVKVAASKDADAESTVYTADPSKFEVTN